MISFSIDPNFRGWTEGTWRLLWNALLGPDPATARSSAGLATRRSAERAARIAAGSLPDVGPSPLRIGVPQTEASRATAVLRGRGVHAFLAQEG